MDQHRGDQPPPRRITINDRRKLHPQAAPSAQGGDHKASSDDDVVDAEIVEEGGSGH